jgi:hypothetical protein
MRRADHLTNAERALTLALVLVATGYAPATAAYRDLLVPRTAATDTTPAPARSRLDAACSREARVRKPQSERRHDRVVPRIDVELPTRLHAAPPATPYQSVFLAPPSLRGPPALG